MSTASTEATTAKPFRGGLLYIHPDDVPLLAPALMARALKPHSYPVREAPAEGTASTQDESTTAGYDTTPPPTTVRGAMADSRAVPRSVRDFIAAMRMPNLRPVSSPRTTQTGVIEPGDLSPAPRRPDSTDYTVLALRLLKREEALTGSKARIHFVPDSTMLKSLSEAFDAIDVLPTIGEHDSVSDEEKALLAKLTLCYNETRAAAPEEPLFYELHQQAMHLLGFIRVLNRVFWHYGGAHEYEAHLVISSPSELNTDFKLCIRPRTPDASRRPTDSRLFVSKEPPKDTIFIIELKREEVAGGDRMQTVLRQMTGENREDKGIVVEVAEGGNSLVWSTLDDGEKTEIGSINGMHLALLQVFFQSHQCHSPWTSVLAGTRSIICRLDSPFTMAVSATSLSGSEPNDRSPNLPKSVIALAFDRSINPIHPANSELFLNLKAMVEDEKVEKKRKAESKALERRTKAMRGGDVGDKAATNDPETLMPPPPPPENSMPDSRPQASSERLQGPMIGMALTPEISLPEKAAMHPDLGKGDKLDPLRELRTVHLESSAFWLKGRPAGAVTLGLPIKAELLAVGRFFDVYEAYIPTMEAKRIMDIAEDATGYAATEKPALFKNQHSVETTSSPAAPPSSSPARAPSRADSKRGRESLDSETSERSSNLSRSIYSSVSGTSTRVDPEEGLQYLPVVLKICPVKSMHSRWDADWLGAPITDDECSEAARAAVSTETELYSGRLRRLQGTLVPRFLGTWTVKSGFDDLEPDSEVYAIVLERLGRQVLDDEWKGDAPYFDRRKAQLAETLNLLHVEAGVVHGDLAARHFRTRYELGADDPPNLIEWPSLPRKSVWVPPADIRVIDFDRAKVEPDVKKQRSEAVQFCRTMGVEPGWGVQWRASQKQ